MPFDALTMAAVADELREKVVGGRIQAVFLPAPLAIGLEVYAHRMTYYLFASAHPQHARVHLTTSKLGRGTEDVTPLLLLLRKYVRDGRLTAVEQPPLERTLALIITKIAPFGKGGRQRIVDASAAPQPDVTDRVSTDVRLIFEIMGRYSNIILVDSNGIVMEAVKHIPAELNRYRVTLPRHPYVPPPPQDKADPRGLSPIALSRVLAAAGGQPAWQTLMRAYGGVSPLLAREAVFRATGSPDAASADVSADALASSLEHLISLLYTHQWTPILVKDGETILDFAPYTLTQFGGKTASVESISAAIQAYYIQETVASDYAGLKQAVQRALDQQRQRVTRRMESLQAQQAVAAEAESLRTKGELLLAYPTQVSPGQRELVLNLTPGEPPTRIALDPELTVVENARHYFQRYAQARDATRSLPPLLEQVSLDLAFLDQLAHDLAMAQTPAEVQEVQQTLRMAQGHDTGVDRGRKVSRKTGSRLPPLSYRSEDGMEILVGRNARQNDELTFGVASPDDAWLHARGVAGSHVIIRNGGCPLPQRTLEYAASLAAAHSEARGATMVAVDYTERRHVRRSKGGRPGLVTYTNEKTIHVSPARSG